MPTLFQRLKTFGKKYIEDYVQDYCSGVPEFTLNSCCSDHDDSYKVIGGPWKKLVGDWQFLRCGWKKAGKYEWGKGGKTLTATVITVYYVGVSIFGWLPWLNAQKEAKMRLSIEQARHEAERWYMLDSRKDESD